MRSVASRPAPPVSKEMRHASFHHRVLGSRGAGRRRASPVRRPFRRPPHRRRRRRRVIPSSARGLLGRWISRGFTELIAFQADGTLQETSTDGTTGIGSWEATGPDSFNLTFNSLSLTGREGSFAMRTIRAAGEVSEDGQSFTAEFTIELTGEGAPAGEYGPGSVTGTRINVEPMGTPVGPVEALFPTSSPRGRHRASGHRTVGDARSQRAPSQQAPNRWRPRQRAPNQQAPNRPGPRRPTLRWQPRRANPGATGAPRTRSDRRRREVTDRTGANRSGSRLMNACRHRFGPDVQESIVGSR